MHDSTSLERARSSFKRRLADERCPTLSEALLAVVANVVRAISFGRLKIGYWTSAAILFLLTLQVSLNLTIFDLVWLERYENQRNFDLFLFHLWATAVAACQFLAARYYSRTLRRTMIRSTVDAMSRPADIEDLRIWIGKALSKPRQIWFCLLMTAILAAGTFVLLLLKADWLLTLGTFFLLPVGWFQGMIGWYFIFPGLTLFAKLTRYEFDIFPIDPGESSMISDLAEAVQETLFVSVAIATLFTTGFFYFDALGEDRLAYLVRLLFILLGTLAPIALVFVFSHYCLAKIVSAARRKSLSGLETAIKPLLSASQSSDEGRAELNSLLDLRERIARSKTVAVDPKGVVGFLTTLLMPLLSLAAAMIKGLLE